MSTQAPTTMRPSAVAGRFFPAEAGALARTVEACLKGTEAAAAAPRAIISPHAGYPYSGRLAGAAWGATAGHESDRIVVLSPSHRHPFNGVALPSQDAYAMPGFDLPIDAPARDMLLERGLAHVEDAAHDQEHGIETQLPFLRRLHPGARVVPLVIGQTDTSQVAAIVDALAGVGPMPPLFVLSSDLSHFLPLEQARAHDAETARLIETGQAGRLTGAHACGAAAIRGFMMSEHGQGKRVQRLGMANSAEVTRDTSRTVGYGAWALFDTTDEILRPDHRAALLKTARQALRARLSRDRDTPPQPHTVDGVSHPLRGHGAAFVTLKKDGRLRGCVGSLRAHRPLVADVAENTVKSALDDPRFAPVAPAELAHITLKIAVLSPSAPMRADTEAELLRQLVPGRDGLILSDKGRRGVFLPMVWDSLPEPADFVLALKHKAGLPRDHWSETLRVERFCAEGFGESV